MNYISGSAGEAAFMTGLERNADIGMNRHVIACSIWINQKTVFSASYAPLLNVGPITTFTLVIWLSFFISMLRIPSG
jgi:hypothetical protein